MRHQFVAWCGVAPGNRVASLCCGSGATERSILASVPDVRIVALDLGGARFSQAPRFRAGDRLEYRQAHGDHTGLPAASFDRVAAVLAFHEMPPRSRRGVIAEAKRVCRPNGRIVVIDRARPASPGSRLLQDLWWGRWLPGGASPEQPPEPCGRNLDRELRDAGLEIVARHHDRLGWFRGVVARSGRTGPSWTPDEIARRYRERGRLQHQRLLLPLEVSREFVRDCRVHGLAAVVIEGFFLTDEGIVSTTGMVRDFCATPANNWYEFRERVNGYAQQFLSQPGSHSGLYLAVQPWTREDWDGHRRRD